MQFKANGKRQVNAFSSLFYCDLKALHKTVSVMVRANI